MPFFHQCSLSHDGSLRTGWASGVWETSREAVGDGGGWWWWRWYWWVLEAVPPAPGPLSISPRAALVTSVLDGWRRGTDPLERLLTPLDEQLSIRREGGT